MTSVLSPVLPERSTHNQPLNPDGRPVSPITKQDALEYLADMLREMSVIAASAELGHARKLIDAALNDIETKKGEQ
jgi:hypothetical protein